MAIALRYGVDTDQTKKHAGDWLSEDVEIEISISPPQIRFKVALRDFLVGQSAYERSQVYP
jgi:hypothetical protein